MGPDHNGIAAFRTSEIRSGWVLPVLRGLGVLARDGSGARVMAGVSRLLLFSTQYRRQSHQLRRHSLTKPPRKLTCVHPSDLPLARFAWMVQALLGLHPSAVARFVTWRLQGSGTGLDTGWSMTTSHAHSSWCNIASRRPLRTVRETCASYGSSLPNAPRGTRRVRSVSLARVNLTVAVDVRQLQVVERSLTTVTAPNPMVDMPRLLVNL